MKNLGVVAFVTLAAALLALSDARNATWGYAGSRDILLHREVVSLDWKFMRVITHDVQFYPRNANRTITSIRAIDLTGSKSGAYATLKKGGPGFRNATIHLKSERNRGLNFAVEILGH